MNVRRNGQPQIAAVTEQIQPDPIATAYDRLQASVTAGKDDPDARAILQAALPEGADAQALTGADVAEALRSENATEQDRARRTIRALIDRQVNVPERALISNWKPEELRVLRPFLLEKWLPSGRPAILFADGGVGKTWLALALCAGIASPPAAGSQAWLHSKEKENVGVPIIGEEFRSGAPVLFATYEDEMPDVFYRLSAIRFGGTGGQRSDWKSWDPQTEMPDLQVLDMVGLGLGPCWGTPQGELTNRRNELLPAGEAVRKVAEDHGTRLLVIDSLAACYASNENGRGSVHEFLRSWDEWGRVQNCTTLFIAHTNKAGEFSGSTAWHNAVRTRWHLGYEKIGAKPHEQSTRYKGKRPRSDLRKDQLWGEAETRRLSDPRQRRTLGSSCGTDGRKCGAGQRPRPRDGHNQAQWERQDAREESGNRRSSRRNQAEEARRISA